MIRYGFAGFEAGVVGEGKAVVDALAMPRNWLIVEDRGKARGRRNVKDIGILRADCVVFIDLSISEVARLRKWQGKNAAKTS